MVKRLALFDFDGTIYDGDSMRDFARFMSRRTYYTTLLLIAIPYFLSLIGLVSKENVKRFFIKRCFGGKTREELLAAGQQFFENHHPNLFPSAKKYILGQQETGTRCVIVSASCAEWLQPFCEALEMELVCTELEYAPDGKSTGNWLGQQVKGAGKVTAIRHFLSLSEYDEIFAFGNTKDDKVLASIAHSYFHRYFSR